MVQRVLAALAIACVVAGCVRARPGLKTGEVLPGAAPGALPGTARVVSNPDDVHVPDFARVPYEPFSRADAVAIALREWRLFGQPVDDDPPGTRPEPLPEDKPERQPGLWQRVGEYWFEGQDASARDSAWTGMHDAQGNEFPASEDGAYAWSAAFISYVMRIDGAGNRFPYSSVHADYINLARQQTLNGGVPYWVINAQAPWAYAPQLGDVICLSRGLRHPIRLRGSADPGHLPRPLRHGGRRRSRPALGDRRQRGRCGDDEARAHHAGWHDRHAGRHAGGHALQLVRGAAGCSTTAEPIGSGRGRAHPGGETSPGCGPV